MSSSKTLGANCFNAVQTYWADRSDDHFVPPEDFVAYMQSRFDQAAPGQLAHIGDVSIVWSRSHFDLPLENWQIDQLKKDSPGYPFGLVIEHAFVHLGENQVFHKASPRSEDPYEIRSLEEVLAPYQNRQGFEVTLHQRKPRAQWT